MIEEIVQRVDLTQADIDVLRESIWHSVQRGDVPDDARARLHQLYERFRFGEQESEVNDAQRIEKAGGLVDIGPGCFGLADRSLLNWHGENYVPQKPTLRVRLHNWWVGLRNRRHDDAPIAGVDRRPVTKVDEKNMPPPSGPIRPLR